MRMWSRSSRHSAPTTVPWQCWGAETLRTIARDLLESVKKNASIDWMQKESIRAEMQVAVKRVLRQHAYPPDSVGKDLDLRRLQPARLRGESQTDHAERGGSPGTVLEDLHAQHPVVGLPDPERLPLFRTVEVHA